MNIDPIFFLVVVLFLIPFVVFFCLQYFHETGHADAAKKQGLIFYPKIRFNFSIFQKTGVAVPATKKDCEGFNSLSLDKKKLITHAGFWRQLIVGIIFILILSSIGYFFRYSLIKNQFWGWIWLELVVSVTVILVSSYLFNVFSSNPLNDWHFLFFDCSKFG